MFERRACTPSQKRTLRKWLGTPNYFRNSCRNTWKPGSLNIRGEVRYLKGGGEGKRSVGMYFLIRDQFNLFSSMPDLAGEDIMKKKHFLMVLLALLLALALVACGGGDSATVEDTGETGQS